MLIMSKKKSKSSHKKRKKLKHSKFEFKWSYVIYIIIIAVFAINLSLDFAKAGDLEIGDGTFCAECCEDCGMEDCSCIEEPDDDADDTEDTNNTTINNSPTITACVESVSASSSTSGDTFTYSYSIVSCQNTSLQVYLRGRNAGTVYLFDGSVSEYGTPAGSGRRSANENFTEICAELGNDQECG